MTIARGWWLRGALVGATILAAVALFRLTGSAFDAASYSDCDNLAGGCLRMRQQYALKAIGVAGGILALSCLWVGVATVLRRSRWWHAVAVGLAAAVLAGAAATDPVHHLDNRYHGWLSDRFGR